jgi:thiamine-monophosphate kinase
LTGESAAGLAILQRGILDGDSAEHRNPTVEYEKAQAISSIAHSLTDVSDGLISELNQIADASHVQIEIDRELLQSSDGFSRLASLATEHGCDVWEWILHGGEDHAFLATVPSAITIPSGFIEIGGVVAGSRVLVDGFIAEHQGFTHFE